MRSRVSLLLFVLPLAMPAISLATPPSVEMLSGEFRVSGSKAAVHITPLFGSFYRIECPVEQWQGVGVYDSGRYLGVFRSNAADAKPGSATGHHSIDGSNPLKLKVTTWLENAPGRKSQSTWERIVPPVSVVPDSPMPGTDDVPFGKPVQIDQLPRVVTQTTPVYPDKMRKSGAIATVIVQVLVRRDGTVGDARVVRGEPGFDEAALQAVRQWRFQPALWNNQPVATWATTPVRFAPPTK